MVNDQLLTIYNSQLIINIMSKEKEGKSHSDKTAPEKNLKEKRAEKAAKRIEKLKVSLPAL
jgi:hypothetical protein